MAFFTVNVLLSIWTGNDVISIIRVCWGGLFATTIVEDSFSCASAESLKAAAHLKELCECVC